MIISHNFLKVNIIKDISIKKENFYDQASYLKKLVFL